MEMKFELFTKPSEGILNSIIIQTDNEKIRIKILSVDMNRDLENEKEIILSVFNTGRLYQALVEGIKIINHRTNYDNIFIEE